MKNGTRSATGKEAIRLLKELVESSHVAHDGEEDECGHCIHCGKVSYKPHDKDCIWKKADDFLGKNKLK